MPFLSTLLKLPTRKSMKIKCSQIPTDFHCKCRVRRTWLHSYHLSRIVIKLSEGWSGRSPKVYRTAGLRTNIHHSMKLAHVHILGTVQLKNPTQEYRNSSRLEPMNTPNYQDDNSINAETSSGTLFLGGLEIDFSKSLAETSNG